MEWIIWIIIVVAFAVIGNFREKKEAEEFTEVLIENKFTLSVKEEIPPKKTGIESTCFAIQLKGLCNNPYGGDSVKILFYIYDNTENEDDNDFGLPVLAAHEVFCEPGSRVLSRQEEIESSTSHYWPDFFTWFYLPKDFVIPPHKGKRKLKFWAAITRTDIKLDRGGFETSEQKKIIHHAREIIDCKFKEVGYMEELINREAVEDLTIELGMGMAAADGHLEQKELNIIKKWVKGSIDVLQDSKIKNKKKKHFESIVKTAYTKAKNKRISTSKLVEEFNDKASKTQKYEAVQLLLDIAGADEKLSPEEDRYINKIVKTTNINLKTFKQMKNKVIANVENIETSEQSAEEMFGITKDMDKSEKCKLLRKEFTKWNNQTTHKDSKRRKRAKDMAKLVADLRKKYNC